MSEKSPMAPCVVDKNQITMTKIYTGMGMIGLVVGVVVWALTNFVSVASLESHINNVEQLNGLKYFPNERGVQLESKVEGIETTVKDIAPKIANQNDMLLKLLVQSEILQRDMDILKRSQSISLNKQKP